MFVLANGGQGFPRAWLARSAIIPDTFVITYRPADAAGFQSLAEAYKAKDAHQTRVGVLFWQVAVRPANNTKAASR